MSLNFDFDEKLEKLAKLPKAARLGVVVAILAGVFAGYYFLSYQEVQNTVGQKQTQAQELQRKLNKVRAVADNLGEFEQEVAELERQLEKALKQLPNRKQFEDLLRDISTVGKKVGVQLKSIDRQPEQRHDFYAEVPFILELEGNYHDVGRFFDRLAKLPRIVNIGSLKVDVASDSQEQTLLRVTGIASTFRFLGEEADQAATDSPRSGGRT
jgi:type IV pilus assembly protein PilO